MRKRWIVAGLAAVNIGFFFLLPREARAQSSAVRVLSSNGIKAVMEELLPQCERAIGHPIEIQFNSAAVLKQKIDAGEAFDVAILTPVLIDDLIQQGKISTGTRSDIARAGIGIAVRAGARKPDISTPAALKEALLHAKSITYARVGASRTYIEKMYERLGIADAVRGKIILQDASGRPQTSVAEGAAEMVITLISEILPVPGIELVGPLPAELQTYITLAAGVGAHAHNAEAAQALIRFLTGPAAAPTFKAKGMEPR